MSRAWRLAAAAVLGLLSTLPAAQAEELLLTLADAREQALECNPGLQADFQNIGLAQSELREARANYLPSITGEVTAAGSEGYGRRAGANPNATLDPRLAAGAINAPSVYDRAAAGVVVNQMVTDFGRTNHLVDSARARVNAEQQGFEDRKQQLLLSVTADYYQAREAQATLHVAQQSLQERMHLFEQISVLQKNKLKSELDTRFAGVGVDQARLLILRARDQVDAALAKLCEATGLPADTTLRLSDDGSMSQQPPGDLAGLQQQAAARRPELQSLRQALAAAQDYAKAQNDLGNPTLSLIGAAGTVPYGDTRLPENYAAGAVNLSIPIFEGGRLRAQAGAARLRAQQAADTLSAAELRVAREVRVSWLDARATFQSIEVAQRLRSTAQQALQLAESRYRLGLSSIVELNRAQLNEIDAEIAYVRSLYDYQIAAAELSYQTGGA